jgi:hypothetical protein
LLKYISGKARWTFLHFASWNVKIIRITKIFLQKRLLKIHSKSARC